jgi:hypothetical protein
MKRKGKKPSCSEVEWKQRFYDAYMMASMESAQVHVNEAWMLHCEQEPEDAIENFL